MALFVYSSSQAAFSFVMSGKFAGLTYLTDHKNCGDDKTLLAALDDEVRVACIAALLAKSEMLKGATPKCTDVLKAEALVIRLASNKARALSGMQPVYKQANTKLMLIKASAGLKAPSPSRTARPEGTVRLEETAPLATKRGALSAVIDEPTLVAELMAYKPKDFTKMERYSLIVGKAFGFIASRPGLFEKTDTPARASAIRLAMLAFRDAMASLPTD